MRDFPFVRDAIQIRVVGLGPRVMSLNVIVPRYWLLATFMTMFAPPKSATSRKDTFVSAWLLSPQLTSQE